MSLTDLRETETKGRRAGRMSATEREALERLLSVVGLSPEFVLDSEKVFGRKAPLFLEIGFGRGTFLVEQASLFPEKDFIGIEIFRPGIAKLLKGLERIDRPDGQLVGNVRIYEHTAQNVLLDCIFENSLDGIYMLFPDPWHKSRHRKRRLISPEFCRLLFSRLRPGGSVVVATDHTEYASKIERVFDTSGFILESKDTSEIWTTAYALKASKKNDTLRTFRFVRR
jgi:tRNA (guanine-N7-)-methyltransferase